MGPSAGEPKVYSFLRPKREASAVLEWDVFLNVGMEAIVQTNEGGVLLQGMVHVAQPLTDRAQPSQGVYVIHTLII